MSENDPMDGAEIGETRTVRERIDLPVINFEPDVFYKSDRIGVSHIEDIDIVENEYGDEMLRVTFEGDLTKCLPRRWDQPITDHPRNRRVKADSGTGRIKQLLVSAVGFFIPFGFALGLSVWLMRLMDPVTITINGESSTFPPAITELVPVVVLVMVIGLIVWVGLNGGFPGGVGRGGRA